LIENFSAHLWWGFALASSIVSAGVYLAGQYLALSPMTKTFWRGLIPLFVLSPVLFFVDIPTSPFFYGATLFSGLIVTYTDTKNFEAANRFGAGITARMKPFVIWLVFLLWFIWDAPTRQALLNAPIELIGVVAMLLIGACSAFYMNRCAVSRNALMFFLPLIALATCVDLLNKTAMDSSGLLSGIIVYAWLQALIITALSIGTLSRQQDFALSALISTHALKVGLIVGTLFILANLTKNAAMSFTTNPSYVTAIMFTNPFWVSLYYRCIRHKEIANIWAGYGLVGSALGLILITSH
tara:strand:- start:50346 stop:51236 length:891 start_codon:yes stop_codon:yes gene_type:complete